MTTPPYTDKNSTEGWLGTQQLFWAVVGLATLLRLYGLGSFSLWYDEGASLYLGQYWSTPWLLFRDAINTEAPLNALLTGLWSSLLGLISPTSVTDVAHDYLLRLLPCAFGVLNCVLVRRVTLAIYGCPKTANVAAFLFAIAPFQIYYAQELRVYGCYVTLSLLAVWSMLRALEENYLRYWAGYVGALTLVLYSHYFGMWLIFTLNVVFVLRLGTYRHFFWRWTAANAVLMVLIAPMLYRAFVMNSIVQEIEIAWLLAPTWKTGLITVKTFFAGYGPTVWGYWPVFLLGLGLWLWGTFRKGPKRDASVMIACLVVVPIAGSIWVWSRAEFSFYEHRLFIFSGVAVLIGAARGVVLLGRLGLVLLALLTVFTVPCLADYYRGDLHHDPVHHLAMWDKVDFRSAARALEAEWQPGDRLVYTSHFSAYSLYHYFPRDQVRLGWDASDEATFVRLMGHESLLRKHHLMPVPKEQGIAGASRVWLLTSHGFTFEWTETTERIFSWLDRVGKREKTFTFDGVALTCFVLSPDGGVGIARRK